MNSSSSNSNNNNIIMQSKINKKYFFYAKFPVSKLQRHGFVDLRQFGYRDPDQVCEARGQATKRINVAIITHN